MAPTLAPGSVCPHVYTEEDGTQLEIDCSECRGANDLSNNKCLSAIVGIMVDGAEPEAIVLKRYIHKRYRAGIVKRAFAASLELARLNRAIASLQPSSDRRCRTCGASKDRSLTRLRRNLLEDPATFTCNRRTIEPVLQATVADCPQALSCLNEAISLATVE